jgi:dTMP kinase
MKYKVDFDIELKQNPYFGLYIALEGIDGSGKTTQVKMLEEYFNAQGKEVVKTHEPRRDGVMGELVNNVLTGKAKIPTVAIQYLFAAQRATFLEELIMPALKRGAVVISDRSFWSAIPYGLLDKYESEREENPDQLLAALSILSMYHEFIAPDLTIILDIPVEAAVKRLEGKGKTAEIYEKKEKLEKLKAGYEFLFDKFPEELVKINAEKNPEEVEKEILEQIKNLPKH